ncbi:MAG: toxin-activating lysine-acyltransferase [Terricaulis sp.]
MAFFSKKPPKDEPASPPPAARASAPAPMPRAPASGAGKANGAAAASQPVDMEKIKQGIERSRRTLVALGEVVSVLMKSPEYRNATLATVQAMVGPAIMSGQYLVLTAHEKTRGASAPVALAMWANVSDEVDRKLSQPDGQSIVLNAADWTSGKIAWLTVLAGDQRTIPALLGRLQQSTLKGRVVKYRAKGEDGKMQVRTLPPPAQGKPGKA